MNLDEVLKDRALGDLSAIVAERTKTIVGWLGAGLSMPSGLPSWGGLRSILHSAAVQKANSYRDPEKTKRLASLNKIAGITDPWNAFEQLHKSLGRETFRAEIRQALDLNKTTRTPHYETLLRIPWQGLLTLNLDDLCQTQINRSISKWHSFTGLAAPRMAHLLNSNRQYFLSLHGILDDYDSWILQKSQMRRLLAQEGYRTIIRSIFLSSTVVFLGVSVDDVTTGGFLEELERLGVNTGPHYWITDRSDQKTDKWAERVGIRIIRYDPLNHHEQFLKILDHLSSYQSFEEEVDEKDDRKMILSMASLPSPAALVAYEPNDIRNELSAFVAQNADSLAVLRDFYIQYRRCIHQAWLVDYRPPDNRFFNLELESSLGMGAFGRVYLGRSDGNQYAVKVLHQDVFDKEDMVQSFRRGIRSIRFLTDENLPGVVKYVQAHEIPASLVMEYIPGLTLLEVVERGYFRDWSHRILAAKQLAVIIRRAHESQRRVLHRDIRPHNIILRNYFTQGDDIDIAVLDFDLSWHRDSTERSVYPHIEGALGYGAPEQFEPGKPGRARTSRVDSFGLGMTLLFMSIGRHPKPREQNHSDWDETLRNEVSLQACDDWRSLPNRYVRLIHSLTVSEQLRRLDFQDAKNELERLDALLRGDNPLASLLAEELMARAVDPSGYQWSAELDQATAQLSGGTVKSSGKDKEGDVVLAFSWSDPGDRNRATVQANMNSARQFTHRKLTDLNWHVRSNTESSSTVEIVAEISVNALMKVLDASVKVIQQVRGKFSF